MNKKILAIAIVLAVIAGAFLASNASAVNPGDYTLNTDFRTRLNRHNSL